MGERARDPYLRREGSIWLSRDPQDPSYATADGPVCLRSHGRFEEPVRPCEVT